jgi:hypothetical protein
MGLSAGLETLCGQAYGAGNYKMLGTLDGIHDPYVS